MAESKKQKFNRRLGALRQERSAYLDHWREINEVLLPRSGRFIRGQNNRGDKRNQKIIDSEATAALGIMTAGMMSGVTSPARRWFRLNTSDPGLREFGPVKSWLFDVENVVYEIFSESNFYQVCPLVYEEMGAYGTACCIQLNDFENVSRFQAFTVGEYMIAHDDRYQVNTMYREASMTVEQVVRAYLQREGGKSIDWSKASPAIKTAWDKSNYDQWVPLVHLIEPNDLHEEDSKLAKDFKFRSVCYEEGADNDKLLHEGGFKRFPVYAPRWHLTLPDTYGRGPGMDALGDIKQLQDQQKKKGSAIAKMVNPPMIAHPALKNARMTTLPGDVTFADTTGGTPQFQPAYQVNPRLNEFIADMQDVRERIRRAFHSDLFLMMAQTDRRQITAEEIIERRSEKLLVLGPVMQRINHDFLDRLVDNTFERAVEAGIIPPPPDDIRGKSLSVEYISDMAAAQKAQGIGAIQDTAAFVGSLASMNPEVLDKFDFDQAVDEFGNMRGIAPGIVRADDDVAKARQARQQQIAQQQAMQNGMAMAQGAKVLGDASTEQGTALGDMLARAGGR